MSLKPNHRSQRLREGAAEMLGFMWTARCKPLHLHRSPNQPPGAPLPPHRFPPRFVAFFLAFFLIFSRGVGSHLSIWSWCGVGHRALPVEARRALSVVHCPNLMRENANIYMTRNGIPPTQNIRIKCTGRRSFRLVRNSLHTTSSVANLFFHFSSSAHNLCEQCALAHCQPRLHWAKAAPWDLGIGHLGSGGQNVFHHESQRCNSRCNVAAVVVGFRGLRWSSTPLARRVQAGVKNKSKTVQ